MASTNITADARSSRNRVVHLTSVHPAMDTRIFHRECVSLASAGYETVLIAPGAADGVSRGVQVVAVGRKSTRVARCTQTAAAVYRAARRVRGDIYHFHDPELIPVGWLLKACCGAKVIYDVHEYYSEILPVRHRVPVPRMLEKAVWHAALEKWPSSYFDHCIFPTESLRAEYARPERSSVLLNLPSVDDCGGETRPWAMREYDIVFVGSISGVRMRFNMEVLQRVAARLPAVRWFYVGAGPEIESWVYRHYDPGFVRHHLTFSPRVSQQDLKNLFARSRVGFNYHPREKRFEVAIPTKVLEYLAAALPVVTTALPELQTMLGGYDRSCLVDSDGPDDYAAAICTLLGNPERAQQIGEAGRQLVRHSLNWEKQAQPKLLEVYGGLLDVRRDDKR